MKNLIFSIYIEIPDDNLQNLKGYLGDNLSRSIRTKLQLNKYKENLLMCKKEYAQNCQAEFKLFGPDDNYKNFLQMMSVYPISEYDKINFYKIWLLEKLSAEYDHVIYMDFDVVPNTNLSYFKEIDMSRFSVHCMSATKENTWGVFLDKLNKNKPCKEHECLNTYTHIVEDHLDAYHWYIKKLCKDAMLMHDGIMDKNNFLANTAIMGGCSQAIQNVKFFIRLSDMLKVFNSVKQECILGEKITEKFFINNEVLFSYLIKKYNLDIVNLPSKWHYVQLDIYKNLCDRSQACLLHIVDKQFEKFWSIT